MKSILLLLSVVLFTNSFGQHLYPEQFDNCKLSSFCLDCGDTKAEPPSDFISTFIENLNQKVLTKLEGKIEVQILIDESGNPCLLSASNQSTVNSKKLSLQNAINSGNQWNPAISKDKKSNTSVSLLLIFENGQLSVQRRQFDSSKNTNFKSVGTPEVKGTKDSRLSTSWKVLNQQNSDLPWDMSRAALTDFDGTIWVGTDNGIVQIAQDESMALFNSKNTTLKPEKYDANKTTSIRYSAIDRNGNKWFIGGYNAYRYDGETWTVYDSLNSPIKWMRKIHVDNNNNVWFTSWRGVAKYSEGNWVNLDTTNSELPTNKTLGVFTDKSNRTWIGTFSGNVRIDDQEMIQLNDPEPPLSQAYISKGYEDASSNIWFSLYNDKEPTKAGVFVLKKSGEWMKILENQNDLFSNAINDFVFDERTGTLWIAINKVGLVRYEIETKEFEIYTNENSELPSTYVMQLTLDGQGNIWAATFAGVARQITK
ncbi:hypothetical protein [Ekhidna sp.]|uniref:ligand-binding sensor domain-containing protein n=1 Tax=Ekhidna sp. TaxID=2608089 RepID=UPI0032EFBD99